MHRVLDLCPLSYRLFYLRCGVGIVQSLESLFYHNARTFVGTFDDQGLVFTKLLKGLLCAGVRFEGVAGEAAGGIQVLFSEGV